MTFQTLPLGNLNKGSVNCGEKNNLGFNFILNGMTL